MPAAPGTHNNGSGSRLVDERHARGSDHPGPDPLDTVGRAHAELLRWHRRAGISRPAG